MKGLLCSALLLTAACDAEILPPEIDQSFFYMLIEPGGIFDGLGTFNHYAIAATIVAADSVVCRTVQRIRLRRDRDGEPFAARADGTCDTIHGNPSFPLNACCTIPGTPPPDSLGALDLQHGVSYEVEVETEGVVILGNVTVPDSFGVSVMEIEGIKVLTWPNVAGSAGYQVELNTTPVTMQTDTSFVLDPDFQGSIRVLALESNLWSYLMDDGVTRAGIDVGLGVFGGISATPQLFLEPSS